MLAECDLAKALWLFTLLYPKTFTRWWTYLLRCFMINLFPNAERFTNTYSCFPGVYSLDEYVIHLLENILPWNWLFSVRGWPLLTGSLSVREQTPIDYGNKQGIECEIYHTKVYFISHFVWNISHSILLTRNYKRENILSYCCQ